MCCVNAIFKRIANKLYFYTQLFILWIGNTGNVLNTTDKAINIYVVCTRFEKEKKKVKWKQRERKKLILCYWQQK